MFPFRYLWILTLLLLPRLACAAATIVPLTSSEKTWITFSISNLPPGTAEICLRDARGGLGITRKIRPAQSTLLVLPLIAPAELSDSQWPIVLTARDADGRQLELTPWTVPLKSLSEFRIALPRGTSSQAANSLWPTSLPIEWIELPPEEITGAPAQAFAGFDALYIPASLASQLDEPRILALRAAGVQVAVATDAQPLPLSHLLWKRMASQSGDGIAASTAWLCTSQISSPLAIINPDLAQLHLSQSPVPRGITTPLLLLGPIALFLAVTMQVLFRRPVVILSSTILALALLAAGTLFALRHADLSRSTSPLAQWHTLRADPNTATGTIDTETTITPCATLFGQEFDFFAPRVLPLIASPRAWWQLNTATLTLESATTQLHVILAPREQLFIQTQRSTAAVLVPAFPTTLEERRHLIEQLNAISLPSTWIIKGYAFPANAESFDSGGIPYSTWSREQSAQRLSLDAWYALHFRADTRYFLWLDQSGAQFIEFPEP